MVDVGPRQSNDVRRETCTAKLLRARPFGYRIGTLDGGVLQGALPCGDGNSLYKACLQTNP